MLSCNDTTFILHCFLSFLLLQLNFFPLRLRHCLRNQAPLFTELRLLRYRQPFSDSDYVIKPPQPSSTFYRAPSIAYISASQPFSVRDPLLMQVLLCDPQ